MRLVGVAGLGFMVWMVAKSEPATDVPGGWVVTGSIRGLSGELGWGLTKFIAETKSLHAAGLIEIVPGMKLGRGGGSTPQRYFLTHSPDLHTPRGPVGGSRFRDSYFGNSQNENVQSSGDNFIHKHLVAAPVTLLRENSAHTDLHVSEIETSTKSGTSVVEDLQQQQVLGEPKTGASMDADIPESAQAKAPKFVREVLHRLGWVGPPPAVDDWDLLSVVGVHLEKERNRFRNPPGFLKKLIEQEGLLTFAQAERLPMGPKDEPSSPVMPFSEYTQKCIDSPEWEVLVELAATRRASASDSRVSMMLKRTVALEIPFGLQQERYG